MTCIDRALMKRPAIISNCVTGTGMQSTGEQMSSPTAAVRCCARRMMAWRMMPGVPYGRCWGVISIVMVLENMVAVVDPASGAW